MKIKTIILLFNGLQKIRAIIHFANTQANDKTANKNIPDHHWKKKTRF